MNCPNCDRAGFDADFTDDSYISIATGIVSIQIECPHCCAIWYGEVEFDFEDCEISLDWVEEKSNQSDKE